MPKENMPPWIVQFWSENPTEYTEDDIHHLEPDCQIAAFLKYMLEHGFATLTIQKNGDTIGTFNGSDLTTINITVPVITYGTDAPSGGNTGDVYMRYLS